MYIIASYLKDDFYVAYSDAPNLNSYSPREMALMFAYPDIPDNIVFQEDFAKLFKPQ